MSALRAAARAKVNWHLRVGARRQDGFHEIATLFQTLALHDDLEFEMADGGACIVEGMDAIPAEENLIVRAWRLLREECGARVGGVHVRAMKRIPMGGGLGGGSSNGAAALRAVNGLFALGLEDAHLAQVGARLGSDVPFLVRGGLAIGRGRGEVLMPCDASAAPPRDIVLALSEVHISTADAYGRLTGMARAGSAASSLDEAAAVFSRADASADELERAMHNDFELVWRGAPWYERACEALRAASVVRPLLCGSGATVAGLAREPLSDQRLASLTQQFAPVRLLTSRTHNDPGAP